MNYLSAQSSKAREDGSGDRRIAFVFAVFFMLAAFLVGRLFVIQVRDHGAWEARAADQRTKALEEEADRGDIYLRDGETGTYPAAINREYPLCYVVPKSVDDAGRTARELARILNIEERAVTEKLSDRTDPFEIIKKRLSDDEAAAVRNLGLPGVGLRSEKYRYYPGGKLASHAIGFASLGERGGSGGYGVEASLEGKLRGEKSAVVKERDSAGRWIALSDAVGDDEETGYSVLLTIDRTMQYETERILRAALDRYSADRTTAIVMETKTGRIRAMASAPDFDPNEYSRQEDFGIFINPVVSMSYEPGSVLKPVTMALGIDAGKVSPGTEYVDTGVVFEGGHELRNSEDKVYGRSSMTRVLEDSINTGVIYVERLLGHRAFREGLKRFGFGVRTGVKLPAEHPGNLANLDDERIGVQFYTASFGQGLTVTPLQMAAAYGALANGGTLLRPLIVERYIHENGEEEEVDPEEVRQVISRETSEEVSMMLESVVLNGHGKRAAIPGYRVAGKTGTAQVAKSTGGGYEEDRTIGTFAGYAPLPKPEYAVVVVIENPKDVQWAESSAAPVFREILEMVLKYEKIEPNN